MRWRLPRLAGLWSFQSSAVCTTGTRGERRRRCTTRRGEQCARLLRVVHPVLPCAVTRPRSSRTASPTGGNSRLRLGWDDLCGMDRLSIHLSSVGMTYLVWLRSKAVTWESELGEYTGTVVRVQESRTKAAFTVNPPLPDRPFRSSRARTDRRGCGAPRGSPASPRPRDDRAWASRGARDTDILSGRPNRGAANGPTW